jgi:hypothetical protein
MSGFQIDSLWFLERGDLHDARLIAVRLVTGSIEITFDDEWVNERGLSKDEAERSPVTLAFTPAEVVAGCPNKAVGSRVSELLTEADGYYRLVLTDRDPLVIKAGGVFTRPKQ